MANFLDWWGERGVFLPLRKGGKTLVLWLMGALWFASAAVHALPLAYLADRNQNDVSVVDMATYSTIASISLGPEQASPVEVVANEVSGKIMVALRTGIVIIDAATQSVTGRIALEGIKAMVVSPDGKKVYALTSGALSIIDTGTQSVITALELDPSAVSLAIDKDGETIYVAHTGSTPDTGNAAAAPGITLIDGLTNEIDSVIETGDFQPEHLAVHPGDDRLYMIGAVASVPDTQAYQVFDPVAAAITRVAFTPAPGTPPSLGLSSLAFNRDGSRLYLGGHTLGAASIPLLEIDTATGLVARVLSLPAGFADDHTVLKLATNFANDKFVLALFVRQRLQNYPQAEPGRRAVFMDGVSGAIFGDSSFAPPGDADSLTGDILSAPPGAGVDTDSRLQSRTVLQTSAPLRRDTALSFFATVSGNNPAGNVVFRFFPAADPTQTQDFPVALSGGMATLALPSCTTLWEQPTLQQLVCSLPFGVLARFRGDAQNEKSKSEVLYPSLIY